MCRIYGFRANEPTRVECSLVHAQNALMSQSRQDMAGRPNDHGWGIAAYPDGVPYLEKQAWAAWKGEHFRKAAAQVYSHAVIAHVRRATVGAPGLENTHPFVHGHWAFAHNGTLPNFADVRELMLPAMSPEHRDQIGGQSDSEHIFRYLLTLWGQHPERQLMDILHDGLNQLVDWCREAAPGKPVGINVLWTDGDHLAGSRLGRTLWYVERDGIHLCPICNQPHVHHEHDVAYRCIEIASEPITDEPWIEVPNGTVYGVDPDLALNFRPIEEALAAVPGELETPAEAAARTGGYGK
jgi:predicted glutamine amidotransferase